MLLATGLVALVVAVSAVARRLGVLAPILLVAAGIAVSFVPGVPAVELDPELVLAGVLPPLLYVTA
ncbi:MAG TPA: Na+/H+ antiporter, partial [Micromonosporaceae bacterium]|nr:Na+/H+ antiporter [Micromonosporaceae bacterium]